jgi:hypothetical protein
MNMSGTAFRPEPGFLFPFRAGMKKGMEIAFKLRKESDEQAKNNGFGLILATPPAIPKLRRVSL